MWIRDNVLFVDGATAACVSDVFRNYKDDEMTIQVDGTFTSATVVVEGRTNPDGEFYPLALIDLSSLDVVLVGEIKAKGRYHVTTSGVIHMRVRVTSVAGGSVTVYGMGINSVGV